MADLPQSTLSLAEFLEEIERRVPPRSLERVLDALRVIAQRVPQELRRDVIDALPEVSAPTDPEFTPSSTPSHPPTGPSAELADMADAFVRRLEDGHYYQGFGWDEERHEERAWGDESWAKEMDELFGRAATSYLSGAFDLAARVYGKLLGAFRHADRPGVFCGPEVPDRMIQTDLTEAKRRYFRSLYEVTSPTERPARLLAEMEALRHVGDGEIGLRSMSEVDGDPPLQGLNTFLPDWVRLLKAVRFDPKGWGREARRLLREAVDLQAGVDGLGKLARDEGGDHPEAYHEWVGMLVRLERIPEAVRAAREGVGRIRDAAYRARLADRLASLAVSENDLQLAVEATRNAWRASPTEVRLLHMAAAAQAADMLGAVLSIEAGAVLRPDWNFSDALACRLLLLAGRHEEAVTRFQRADALGWGRIDHAGSVVLPFLLLASTGLEAPPQGSAIEGVWSDLDAAGRNYFDRRLLMDRMGPSMEPATSSLLDSGRPYSDLLKQAVAQHPIPDVYRSRMLAAAQLKVESVVRDILNGQHRRGHALAAKLTVAVAEAIALTQKVDDGLSFVKAVRKEYRRFSVFKDELDTERKASPVLPDPKPSSDRPSLVVVK